MKIIEVKELAFPEVKVIRYQRFIDNRGYFTETYRLGDFESHPRLAPIFTNKPFIQTNESYSKKNVIRGMHIQWNPAMGKLVRTILGHMVDIVMDLRKGSPNYGKMIAYDMPNSFDADYADAIWIPEGFAHGNYYVEDSKIEYSCNASWNPKGETSISPLAKDIDWSVCDPKMYAEFTQIADSDPMITEKDRDGYTITSWNACADSDNFVYKK
jgi:dTDP-4-dehydrorhamnose 3,5-epimerase